MTSSPNIKHIFSQRKSTKLEQQNPPKVENTLLTDVNVKRDLKIVFLGTQMSQDESGRVTNVVSVPLPQKSQGQAPCSKSCSLQTQSKILISYPRPIWDMVFQDWLGGVSRHVKGELTQRNFLDFVSLLLCPKAGQCSAKLFHRCCTTDPKWV